MFANRDAAGRCLAEKLRPRHLTDPIVLGLPRGGVMTAAATALNLHCNLDVVLSAKLRAPWCPEESIGAVSEGPTYFLLREIADMPGVSEKYVAEEIAKKHQEIKRLVSRIRKVRPIELLKGRSVIVVDDVALSGATMSAALQSVQTHSPAEIIAAIPVASAAALGHMRPWCDDIVCLQSPTSVSSINDYYDDFLPVTLDDVIGVLRETNPLQGAMEKARCHGAIRPRSGPPHDLIIDES